MGAVSSPEPNQSFRATPAPSAAMPTAPPPPPLENYASFPAGAQAEGAGDGANASALQAAADAVRASSATPIVIHHTSQLMCDGRELASVVDEYQSTDRDRSGVPQAPPG